MYKKEEIKNMKKNLPFINKTIVSIYAIATLAYNLPSASAQQLSWASASSKGGSITTWLNLVISALMACFIMSAVIMGSLAFKQLASDGNWKDFWSKIAGAIGMFITPIVIYWVVSIS